MTFIHPLCIKAGFLILAVHNAGEYKESLQQAFPSSLKRANPSCGTVLR
jgi:hypothetical protein